MALTIYIGLLIICLSLTIEIAQAAWDTPPFFKPVPNDTALNFFQYDENTERTRIVLDEEVDRDVCIAVLNYKDDVNPIIGAMSEDKSNFVLGAELRRNESTKNWSLWITKKQDYETPIMQEYSFPIIVDSSEYTIALNIRNIDDNAPVIHSQQRSCSIEENYEGPSGCNYVIRDADGWIDQVEVTSVSDPIAKNFRIITSPVSGSQYELQAYLNVTESLDFETISMYMLLIRAIDGGNNEGNLTTVIQVIDMPDMPPAWTRLTASENILEKSTKSFEVSAIDGDVRINAEINYRIEVNDPKDEGYFEVDQKTGLITINPIDRDARQQEIYRFLIFAYEVPEPTSIINATIIVIVEDINDNVPEITPEVLDIEIDEEKYTTLEFEPSIEINDPDLAENAQFTVTLTDDSEHKWSSAFLVVPTSGYQSGIFTISVINASLLDYEDENWREIDIQLRASEVSNTSHVGIRKIHIGLKDWNDELPIFDENTPTIASVPEDVGKSFSIATVHASDRDYGDKVTHSLVAQRALTIHEESGVITTNQDDALDYESMPIVVVQIVATDTAEHKTYATLTINVTDVNDVPPSLYLVNTSLTLVEEVSVGTEVEGSISASDIDTDGDLIFSIDWENTRAQKGSVPVEESLYREHLGIRTDWPDLKRDHRYAIGTLFVTDRIDYEAFDIIFLKISVTDRNTVHNANTTSASLTLNIEDINDNEPKFGRIEMMNVTENQLKDALIGRITATDDDGPKYNRISYYIEPINDTKNDLILIDSATGLIKVDLNMGIDAEEYEFIYYKVIASDGDHNTSKNIEIFVIDLNDNVPHLADKTLNTTISMREKTSNGTKVVRVEGADDDRTYPFNNVSHVIMSGLSSASQYFSIGRFDGWIRVNLTDGYILDRDAGPSSHTLNLELRDNYLFDFVTSDTNWINLVVTIVLEDINDKKPELPEIGEPAASISENAKKNDFIFTVTAKDDDDPNTDNTKVFYEIKNILSAEEENENVDENCKTLFYVETHDQSSAHIFANCDLKGYYGRWTIELYAQDLGTDPGPLNDTRSYVIQVKDYNYNSPEIQFPTSQKIPLRKEQALHEQLKTYDNQYLSNFKATDSDRGASGEINFSLTSTTGDHEYFEIVPISTKLGQLRLRKVIDPEIINTYTLTLIATDGGDPPLQDTQEFTVVFITQSSPKFENNEWEAWIKENKTGVNETVTIPPAYDMMGENTVDIFYFLMPDEEDAEYFTLNKTNRELRVIEELDREKKDKMILQVVAATDNDGPPTNPPKDAVLKVIVIVLDENDNPPIFENKNYSGGVAMEDALDKVVLTVKATDADINETLTYTTNFETLAISDSSLNGIINPFTMDPISGDLALKFTAISNMKGFFKFDIIVHDVVNHSDTAEVQIYIVSQNNRVVFTFNNLASYVKEERMFVIETFSKAFGFKCNIDDIKSTVGSNDQILDNSTTVTTHFIDNNLPTDAEKIILSSSDLQTIRDLKAALLTRSLYLTDVPTGSSTSTNDMQQTLHWTLVTLTSFFCLCSVTLLVIFILRTRTLNQRLEKLAITKFGSQESGLDRAGVVPTTNQFAIAGSNPIWKTTEKNIDDNISQGSGDSDLIGVENNPDFGYVNGAMMAEGKWQDENRGNVNPVFANPKVTSCGFIDRANDFQEDKKNIYNVH